jgi:hypothetical protein
MAEQAQHPTDSHHAYRICDLVHGVSSPFVCAGNYSITGEPVTIQAAQVVIPFTKNTPRVFQIF